MLLVYPLFAVVPNAMGVDRPTATLFVVYACLALTALRCPLTTLLTFKAKDRADMKDREARQEREREFALRKRADKERARRELEDIGRLFYKPRDQRQRQRHLTRGSLSTEITDVA